MEHCQLTEDFMSGQNLHYWQPVNAMLPPPVQKLTNLVFLLKIWCCPIHFLIFNDLFSTLHMSIFVNLRYIIIIIEIFIFYPTSSTVTLRFVVIVKINILIYACQLSSSSSNF